MGTIITVALLALVYSLVARSSFISLFLFGIIVAACI